MNVKKNIAPASATLAFLSAFSFFQLFYPYHLMRREQLSLFLYDWDYIARVYSGTGGMARFIGDFLTQFFYFPLAGPLAVSLILLGIAIVSYKIARKFLNQSIALSIAAAVFAWSFLRECGNWYDITYSISVLGYLTMVLALTSLGKNWKAIIPGAVVAASGIFLLGSPYQKESGKLWAFPSLSQEHVISLDVESARNHWTKVQKLASKKDYHFDEATYYYNLANAQKGQLSEKLLQHSQHYTFGLFRWVYETESVFTITAAGEVWFHLGDMTLAEQSAMVAMEFSPKHTGARFLVRLAQIALVNGDDGSAVKYLGMLSKTLNYRNWALKMMPGNHDRGTEDWLAHARSLQSKIDFVHGDGDKRPVLRALLETNPENDMAREYLLCFDLLTFDIESFMADYESRKIQSEIYQQAVLIWASYHNMPIGLIAKQYGISESMIGKFNHFSENPEQYRNSYWYMYMLEQQQ